MDKTRQTALTEFISQITQWSIKITPKNNNHAMICYNGLIIYINNVILVEFNTIYSYDNEKQVLKLRLEYQ